MNKTIIHIFIALLVLALAAQISISIPVNEGLIPITGQTLAVLLVGYFLGEVWGTLAVALYVLLGLLGLPILAEGKAGWSVLTGGSGGYLIGFIVGAYTVGRLKLIGMGHTFFKAVLNQSLGTVVILVFGVGWLTYLYGFEKGLLYGFYPFWKGAVIKVLLGALVIVSGKWIIENGYKA